jgi:hypothetical protein
LIHALLLPALEIVRLISTSSEKGISISFKSWEIGEFAGTWKKASTTAISAPDLTRSGDARPPKIKFTAFTIIDFPAPVSPDIILNPSEKPIDKDSIIAKSVIVS